MFETSTCNDSTHTVSNKVDDSIFLLHIGSEMSFDLISKSFTHIFYIGFCVIFVTSGDEIDCIGKLCAYSFTDNTHVI